jgi:arylsulfatase A-like enzyme
LKSQCREGRERYRAEVAFVDHLIGQIVGEIEALGLADDTIVIVTADHGEAFYEHENCQHTGDLYEELVRIPLIVRWPRVIPARWRSNEPIGLVDVMPTVLDLVRLQPGDAMLQGRSVADALREEDARIEPHPLYFVRARFEKSKRLHGRRWIGTQYGIRDGRWKYMEAPDEKRRSLYDLETDPQESDNLIAERPEQAARLATDLAEWRKRSEGARPEWLQSNGVDREKLVEGLRALGYVE